MQILSTGAAVANEEHAERHGAYVLRRLLATGSEFTPHVVGAARRSDLESYITRCFARAYKAKVNEFAPLLLELRCAGTTSGVAGLRLASEAPLFGERYLDSPIEQVASKVAGKPVQRNEIAELCNLAALRPGACQLINLLIAAILHGAGFRYASFAGTQRLERIVRKQHFVVQPIAVADAARLGADAEQWGSYYDSCPNVLLVDLQQTMQALRKQYAARAVFTIFAEAIEGLSDDLRVARRKTARAIAE